jgi:hypothetical protein
MYRSYRFSDLALPFWRLGTLLGLLSRLQIHVIMLQFLPDILCLGGVGVFRQDPIGPLDQLRSEIAYGVLVGTIEFELI